MAEHPTGAFGVGTVVVTEWGWGQGRILDWEAPGYGVLMAETYAVVWAEGEHPIVLGRLGFEADGFRLSGEDAGQVEIAVRGREIRDVRLASAPGDRLREMKTMVVSRRVGDPIRIAAVNGMGAVFEIAEVLERLSRNTSRFQSVLVCVPIRAGRRDAVRELIGQGPPFDPDEIPGLRHHEVFFGQNEVAFLFQGQNVRTAVDQLARNPAIWNAAIHWRKCIAGRPSIIESAYRWSLDQHVPATSAPSAHDDA